LEKVVNLTAVANQGQGMAISGISNSIASVGAYESQAQSADAQNSSPLTTLQQKQSAVQAQLSSIGRVTSSLADLQAKAQALKDFSKSPTVNDYKGVVQAFVQSFNNLSKIADEAAAQKQNASNADLRVSQAVNEVRNAISGVGDTTTGSVRKLGIERQKDGTFAMNQKTLDQAFKMDQTGFLNTLSDAADRVGKTIDKQLSSSGIIGRKVQDLSVRGNELENSRSVSQTQLDRQKTFQQRLATQLANVGGYGARNAVTTYFNVASL
jgi:flagellar capping protein FliD